MSRRGYGGLSISMADRDFQEEEIWDAYNYNNHTKSPPKCESNSSSHQRATRTSSLSRMFGRDGNKSYRVKSTPQSVPVLIRNCSKFNEHCGSTTDCKKAAYEENEDEVYEVPPHEWLERKHSRRQSFSVMEGAGRTLKGRDLSKVRDSVLTRTGFIE